MRRVFSSEKETVEELFQNSIYTNEHLGWLTCWDILENSGEIWIDNKNKRNYLIAFTSPTADTLWLHSFYSNLYSPTYPLHERLAACLPPGRHSVYAISSHRWFSNLLERNGFRHTDEIVQLETESIEAPSISNQIPITPLTVKDCENILQTCEAAFPPLWRLSARELEYAIRESNYCIGIKDNGKISAYLLANMDDSTFDIQRLAVTADSQNQGYASMLIRHLVSSANDKNIHNFSVNTNRNNTSAIDFYKKAGFREIRTDYPVYHSYIISNGFER